MDQSDIQKLVDKVNQASNLAATLISMAQQNKIVLDETVGALNPIFQAAQQKMNEDNAKKAAADAKAAQPPVAPTA